MLSLPSFDDRRQVVRRGRRIFHQGDPAEAIHVIESGCVRLQVTDEDGVRDIVAFMFPGDVLCVGLDAYWASAEAVTDCVLRRLTRSSVLRLMSEDPHACLELLGAAQQSLDEMAHHIGRLVHRPGIERLAWFMGWMADKAQNATPPVREIALERQDIADFLALAPETVSRLYHQLDGEPRAGERRYVVTSRPPTLPRTA